ncbi:MAG: metallophosphoesterase [Armatimonadota bacterium]
MAIYAISDLHLSLAEPKPMDIFGPVWKDHAEKIRRNWDEVVGPEDTVLIPGDVSWGLRFEDAVPDLEFVAERPGLKVLTRGNHDYWWQRRSTTRIQRLIDREMVFLQGTSVVVDGTGITGTRGWRVDWEMQPESGNHYHGPERLSDGPGNRRILNRELQYLENGLKSIPESVDRKIVMLHFPPFDMKLQPNKFAEMIREYGVDILVYGHVHLGLGNWLDGLVDGVEYRMVSADVVDFVPQLIVG